MLLTKSEIVNYLKEHKTEFFKKYSINSFGLFGSFARNQANEESDIDLIYTLDEGKYLRYSDLLELENQLQTYFKRKIELINYRWFNPIIKYNAEKEIIYV